MSWRTVLVSKRCKLDMSLGYLEIRSDEIRKIHLSEIGTIVIESTGVSLTAALLCELIRRKVTIIFCDEQRNPCSELLALYGSYDASGKVRQQVAWTSECKALLWTEIVAEKIRRQQAMLTYAGQPEKAAQLAQYIDEIRTADESNREGHAAKVYFGGVFGAGFTRYTDSPINLALNYGYAILLSTFNREIVCNGYLTQLGVFHSNLANPFNLACDLMEPYRPLVDRIVYELTPEDFGREEKLRMLDVLNHQVIINHNRQYVSNAISIYCKSVFKALNENDMEELRFYEDELSLHENDSIL